MKESAVTINGKSDPHKMAIEKKTKNERDKLIKEQKTALQKYDEYNLIYHEVPITLKKKTMDHI